MPTSQESHFHEAHCDSRCIEAAVRNGADGTFRLESTHPSSEGVTSSSSGLKLSRVLLEAAAFLLLLFCALLLCLRSLLLLMTPSNVEEVLCASLMAERP